VYNLDTFLTATLMLDFWLADLKYSEQQIFDSVLIVLTN